MVRGGTVTRGNVIVIVVASGHAAGSVGVGDVQAAAAGHVTRCCVVVVAGT